MSARHRREKREMREAEAAEWARQERIKSAAPQLLEALERCLSLLDVEQVAAAAHGLGLVPARQRARAAIAAALKGTP